REELLLCACVVFVHLVVNQRCKSCVLTEHLFYNRIIYISNSVAHDIYQGCLDLRGFQQIVERIACHQRISRCEAKFSQLFLCIIHIIKRSCCFCLIPCACAGKRCVVRCFPASIRVVVVCVDCIVYCSERNLRRSCIGRQKLHPH